MVTAERSLPIVVKYRQLSMLTYYLFFKRYI